MPPLYALSFSLLLWLTSLANCSEEVQQGPSPGDLDSLYYGISEGQDKQVCPVLQATAHTILQPLESPRSGGSFFVESLDDEAGWFTFLHVVEPCWQNSSTASAASGEMCDKLYITRVGNPERRANFRVRYVTSSGATVLTQVLYGPQGVSLLSSYPEDGRPLFLNQNSALEFELRLPQSLFPRALSSAICEKIPGTERFKHSAGLYTLASTPTSGCLNPLNAFDGSSVPYITRIVPRNLSSLFADPSTIYLIYGSCTSSSNDSLTVSSRFNITTTDYTTPDPIISTNSTEPPPSSAVTRDSTVWTTLGSNTPPPNSSSVESTGTTVDPTTADHPTSTTGSSTKPFNDPSPTTNTPVIAATQKTTQSDTTHLGSTHTAIGDNSFHLNNVITFVSLCVTFSVLLLVMVAAAIIVIICVARKKCRRKNLSTTTTGPEVKVSDGNIPRALTFYTGADTDSGVVEGTPTSGGTPLSDHNFAMTSPEDCCGSNAGSVEQHRKGSELADSSVSNILKTVTDTKRAVEDLRDHMYSTQLESVLTVPDEPGESGSIHHED